MARTERSLNDKQKRFVDEYLIDLDATAAARRAGYSERNASQIAYQLLQKTSVQEAIKAGQKRIAQKLQVSAEKVITEYARLAFSDLGQIMDFGGTEVKMRPVSEIPEDARRAISSFKVKRYMEGHGDDAQQVEVVEFKLWSKNDALDKLARHLGIMVEKHEHTVKGGGKPIEVRLTLAEALEADRDLDQWEREHGRGDDPGDAGQGADPPGSPQVP